MARKRPTAEWLYAHKERSGRGRATAHRLKGYWLFEGVEEFPELGGLRQLVQIGDFTDFGRGLVIDGMSQLAEAIEPTYTTALLFPAALFAGSRRRWLIAGGGDGAAAREALSFKDTEEVVLVDLSHLVIAKTQELIPSFWGGCERDPRLIVITRDVFQVMREFIAQGRRFDVVISDLTDPAEPEEYTPFSESTADHLYTPEGLKLFHDCLDEGGSFVMQAQELSLIRWQGHARLRRMVEKIFPSVHSYRAFIEFFGYWESFLIAHKDRSFKWSDLGSVDTLDPINGVDVWLHKNYDGALAEHYGSEIHNSLFGSIPSALWGKMSG